MWGGAALALAACALTACSDDAAPTGQPGARTEASASPSDTSDSQAAGRTSDGPTRPRTAGQALRLLVSAEATIDDPATKARALVRAARTQQLVYRELGAHPGLDEVDGGKVLPADAVGPLTVPVEAQQLLRGRRRDDPPGGQLVRQDAVHGPELAPRGDVGAYGAAQLGRDAGQHGRVPAGVGPELPVDELLGSRGPDQRLRLRSRVVDRGFRGDQEAQRLRRRARAGRATGRAGGLRGCRVLRGG